jgi:hypothetical protein
MRVSGPFSTAWTRLNLPNDGKGRLAEGLPALLQLDLRAERTFALLRSSLDLYLELERRAPCRRLALRGLGQAGLPDAPAGRSGRFE